MAGPSQALADSQATSLHSASLRSETLKMLVKVSSEFRNRRITIIECVFHFNFLSILITVVNNVVFYSDLTMALLTRQLAEDAGQRL